MEEEKNVNVQNETEVSKEEVKEENHKNKKKRQHEECEKLKAENKNLNDKILRLAAEMQNMKRRYEEEISKMYKYEGETFIKKTLGILDNFERAINMDDENLEDEVSKFLNGFKLIYNDLKNSLDEIGVKEIKSLDEIFDPNKMEAVMTECVEDKESGVVTCVMQKGYTYNDKVIRPAMVKVNER